MKILAVSDLVVERLYSPHVVKSFPDVELILGCGDLPYEFLEFLVSALNKPLLYVPGNHDPAFNLKVAEAFAQGGENMDRVVRTFKGLNIAGIGGSIRYRPDAPNQYTQFQMYRRVVAFIPRILWHLFRHGKVLDIVIAHSPPFGIHDDIDPAHTGFSSFRDFILTIKPRYFLHGHTMVYKNNLVPPVSKIGDTTVINVYPYRLLNIEHV